MWGWALVYTRVCRGCLSSKFIGMEVCKIFGKSFTCRGSLCCVKGYSFDLEVFGGVGHCDFEFEDLKSGGSM